MKILYISNYKDGTGWSHAACDYILAMDSAGIDVVPRAIKLNSEQGEISPRILELEKKSDKNCNIVIQHTLPYYMEYDGHFQKNIGLFVSESSHFKNSIWPDKLNFMDEVWVVNHQMVDACKNSGITKKVRIIPHACDTTKYEKTYQPLNIPELAGKFVFYFIGENNIRKNLLALLQAFHLEFGLQDSVGLVIKTDTPGMSPEQTGERISTLCKNVKENMKLYTNLSMYHREVIISSRLSEHDMCRLHATGHCLVNPSFGEAWCTIPSAIIDTKYGFKEIQDITTNDYVFTHTGQLQKVNKVLYRNYTGTLINIQPHGTNKILQFTPNHRHYIVKRNNIKNLKNIDNITPEFIEAKDIQKGDLWAIPKRKNINHNPIINIKISDFIENLNIENDMVICESSYPNSNQESLKSIAQKFNCSYQTVSKVINKYSTRSKLAQKIIKYCNDNNIQRREKFKISNTIPLTPEVMFFIGHYIAEGWSEHSHIGLATHINEKLGRDRSSYVINNLFNIPTTEHTKNNSTRLTFNNNIIGKLLRILCGHGSRNKFIHHILKQSDNIKYLLQGMYYGDGSITSKRIKYDTSSKQLAFDTIDILNRHNILALLTQEKRNEHYTVTIPAQHFNRFIDFVQPIKYNTPIQKIEQYRCNNFIEDNDNFYIPIFKITHMPYDGIVMNLSVDNDESYTSFGYATHNCIPAFDAMAFGKTPICTDIGGPSDYLRSTVDKRGGYLVPYSEQPVFGMMNTFPDIMVADENWYSIDINALRKAMRDVYEKAEGRQERAKVGIERAYDYSYTAIGQIMKEFLENGI